MTSVALIQQLRRLVPASARQWSAGSRALPIELGQLLSAAAREHRSLLAFAPPPGALAAVSAGILRAAREREAAVVLRVDLSASEGRGLGAALEGLCGACDEARYRWPLGLSLEVAISEPQIQSGESGRAVAEALAAGFPSVVARLTLPLEVAGLAGVLELSKDRGLGCAVALAALGVEPEGLLADLHQAGASIAAVLGDREMALAAQAFRWAAGDRALRELLLDERPPVIEIDLQLPAEARGERAEALAYFAAEAALVTWDAERSGPQIGAALLAQLR